MFIGSGRNLLATWLDTWGVGTATDGQGSKRKLQHWLHSVSCATCCPKP